ncbi:MAG: outer membrane protein assembly factor BamA [Candidatus Omnitrophica bacterium CG11_big_fil_rev_8_21_14_0_20_63_9]|nr:MAG: outer membrane protein assembly factor BamA [Candidatus Omnitrophica bacterium CG11_big_fil_rev_8_21_14_0_20_63_9]
MRNARPRFVACVLTGILAFVGAASVWAQYEGERIIEVDVAGTQTVAAATILAKVQTKPGSLYADQVVSEDIRRIFALGYFTDVRADVEQRADGLRLTFAVTEKPTVSAVQLSGNRIIPKAKLLEIAGLKEGELYDPRKLKQASDLIKAEYLRRGFSQCEVVSDVKVDARANTAGVSLLVDEGPRMRVNGILVEGNQAFSDKRVRKLLKTKRRNWLFFAGVYNEQVLEEDLERIKAFYRTQGYQDVAVTHDVRRDPRGRGLFVHFTISEGLQHRVGQVMIEGTKLFPEREIRQVVTLKPGAVFSDQALQEDLRQIKQYYGDRGYIHADVAPHPQLDPRTKRVDLTYHITENELVYVNRIDIRGNLRTKDVVVRRELRLLPGEAFDGTRIRKSVERLQNLGFFEEVNVETEPTATEEKEDLIVQLKEAKTGSFSFGGGFSSVDRLVGLVELEQRNFDWKNFPSFTGAGQDLRFRVEAGTVRRFFDISFTEPWIFGHPISFGIDLYNRTRLRSGSLGLGFEEERRGGGIRLGREFADIVQTGLSYQVYRTEISDVAPEASADLKAEEGRNTISVLGSSVALDRRNNRFDPTDGGYAFISADLAGGFLAADKDFYRLQTGASYYFPHGERLVLESRVRTGIVDAYGDSTEVPIFERFFGGGASTIRGFRERRVGPVDPLSNDPIGGEATFVATLEEVVTVVKDERGRPILKASGFLDVGDVWRRVADYGESLKAGTGIGARVNTPIGPLRLDLGFPLSDVKDEPRKPRFHFNISRSF